MVRARLPPLELLVVGTIVIILAIISVGFTIGSQLAGPVATSGIQPQTIAGLKYGLLALTLFVLAFLIFLQHPLAWIVGGVTGVIVFLYYLYDFYRLYDQVGDNVIAWGLLIFPALFAIYFYVRRDAFDNSTYLWGSE
ncbi:hypothetical protein [Natrarchaeobius oligotrophus]|uniref:hypothetical protein n=1 Tax=Natrarchaeobius oligotrophus TaxID=3455743 RepID=UPI000F52689D|nr:hypothetical protein [Natrarchaeobius chitinivorans]